MAFLVYERPKSIDSYTKMASTVYERPIRPGPYTKMASTVYERPIRPGPYTKMALLVYERRPATENQKLPRLCFLKEWPWRPFLS